METIPLGPSGLKTSRIGLGTWAIGGSMWGGSDGPESISTIHAAIEHGVTLIDTAPVYGFGRSEEIVGKALEGGRRGQVQIATKAGLGWQGGAVFRDSRPQRIRQELEDSLRRLRTDYIDLYQVHWPDPLAPLDETAALLDKFRRDGKIRAVGVSNFTPAQMDRFRTGTRLDTVQPPCNLFEREVEADVLPYARMTALAAELGWHIDHASRLEIDAILARCVPEPIPPSFMAPPARQPLPAEH
jgi:aryl-alcohol dehydrogenase-like predicted oxidoreductase